MIFLSTPSVRRATFLLKLFSHSPEISIHALRAEGDFAPWPAVTPAQHFYPRPPCGGRLLALCKDFLQRQFLSTPSVRRATDFTILTIQWLAIFLSTPSVRRATRPWRWGPRSHKHISIHALRAEGDPAWAFRQPETAGISIHALRAEGDLLTSPVSETSYISIHALRAEGDAEKPVCRHSTDISIHALRAEGDVYRHERGEMVIKFLSTPSVRRATIHTHMIG